jgi:4-alpha-glucanotransferase
MTRPTTGICAAIYSLRSTGGAGIGDFGDVRLLADLAAALGLDKVVLQNVADSSFAGGGEPIYPVYVDLRPLSDVVRHARISEYEAKAAELNTLPQMDYPKVYNVKMHLLRERFLQEGGDVLSSDAYHGFWKASREWLEPYSVYCSLRHKYGTGNSRYWAEPDYKRLLEDDNFIKEYSDDIRFHLYVQFLLHKQMQEAMDYATSKGVSLCISGETPRNVFLRQWWTALPDTERSAFYNDSLGIAGDAPQTLEPWVAEAVIIQKLAETASEVILPAEDWLAMTTLAGRDANLEPYPDAAGDRPDNWHYRMDFALDRILSHHALLASVRKAVAHSVK